MATQPACETIMNFEIVGCIRGHHIFNNIWTPEIGDVLMCVREPENSYDKNAVALKKCRMGPTIGHISRDLSSAVSSFLCNDVNKATSVVTGKRMNRGTGFGSEVPCVPPPPPISFPPFPSPFTSIYNLLWALVASACEIRVTCT